MSERTRARGRFDMCKGACTVYTVHKGALIQCECFQDSKTLSRISSLYFVVSGQCIDRVRRSLGMRCGHVVRLSGDQESNQARI